MGSVGTQKWNTPRLRHESCRTTNKFRGRNRIRVGPTDGHQRSEAAIPAQIEQIITRSTSSQASMANTGPQLTHTIPGTGNNTTIFLGGAQRDDTLAPALTDRTQIKWQPVRLIMRGTSVNHSQMGTDGKLSTKNGRRNFVWNPDGYTR